MCFFMCLYVFFYVFLSVFKYTDRYISIQDHHLLIENHGIHAKDDGFCCSHELIAPPADGSFRSINESTAGITKAKRV